MTKQYKGKVYKDYPHVHSFIAGHAAENSVPLDNAREIIALFVVDKIEEQVFAQAEEYLKGLSKNHQELFSLGYQQAMGTEAIAEAPDTTTHDRLMAEYDKALGLADPSIEALVKLIY